DLWVDLHRHRGGCSGREGHADPADTRDGDYLPATVSDGPNPFRPAREGRGRRLAVPDERADDPRRAAEGAAGAARVAPRSRRRDRAGNDGVLRLDRGPDLPSRLPDAGEVRETEGSGPVGD